jgi:hypothetical protein
MPHFGAYAQKALNNNLLYMLKMNNTTFAVIAVVSALAMFGVVMVTVAATIQLQHAEAVGCPAGVPGANASKGRCFRG